MRFKFLLLLPFFLFFLLLVSCEWMKPSAAGVENEILVFISNEDKSFVEPLIETIYSRKVMTPEPEQTFVIRYLDPTKFLDYKRYNNLLVVSLLTPADTTGDNLVKMFLPESQYDLVKKGERHFFVAKNQYSRGQVLSILSALSMEELYQSIMGKERWLFDQYNDPFLKRQEKYLSKKREDKEIINHLASLYAWKMRVIEEFELISEKPENNFVWLGRAFPHRWVSVHWVDNPRTQKVSFSVAKDLLHLHESYFTTKVRFKEELLVTEQVGFNDAIAWQFQGLWEAVKDAKGGPFVSYIFYDKNTNRIYHINYLVFNPGVNKMLTLQQMDVFVRTFETIPF